MSFKYMVIGEQTFGYDSAKTPLPPGVTNVDFHDQQFFRALAANPPKEATETFDMLLAFGLCHESFRRRHILLQVFENLKTAG
jgi:hypothetical protein